MFARLVIPILALAAQPALAQGLGVVQPATAAARPDAELHVSYAAYAAGLNVLDLDVGIDLNQRSYRLELNFRTAGVFSAVIHANIQSIVAGLWQGSTVAPTRYYSYGTFRGEPRRTQIDYVDGQPMVKILEPPEDEPRDPIPPTMMHDTVDTLSAIALLVHTVAVTGRCDGHVATYDGRRTSVITATDSGQETLPADSRSIFAGATHRCDFNGRQTGGFAHDADHAELERPQHGVAWLATALPGQAPIPVQMQFHTRFFGNATMYLTSVEPGPELPGNPPK
jgi:hypothetical protein